MKSVLISIQPKWCELIAIGEKTVDVRKTRPKLETPFRSYIYCTKDEPLYRSGEKFCCNNGEFGNGKVIGEFVCDYITQAEVVLNDRTGWFVDCMYALEGSMLNEGDILSYCAKERVVYGWHISDLAIYDKPKELSEFRKAGALSYDDWLYGMYNGTTESTYEKYLIPFTVTRPPQSWCYVEGVA